MIAHINQMRIHYVIKEQTNYKTAKVCSSITKVLYLLSFAICLTFVILAIVLPITGAISTLATAETATIFATLTVYAFVLFFNYGNELQKRDDETL